MTTEINEENTHDEVLVMPVEEFMRLVQTTFDNVPFVALNLTRSIGYGDKIQEGQPSAISLVAIGFDGDYTHTVPDFMATITNHENMYISTVDDSIAKVLQDTLDPTLDAASTQAAEDRLSNAKVVEF